MAMRLRDAGAQVLAMPCNTAHHFAPEIRAAITVPFIDMVQLSTARAVQAGGAVGILASPAVRNRARDLGIELQFVPGSGPAGRIEHGVVARALGAEAEVVAHLHIAHAQALDQHLLDEVFGGLAGQLGIEGHHHHLIDTADHPVLKRLRGEI